ncbi:MAG: hypothetical protein P0Y59_02665 [Candidatus Sphingomonas phytovorans]|nr:hypothetical protein [Sphingomonas sp.]WEK00614.1 MAG: hypothetical protein P0Y59_02665 [Sphingomonas sp.]
MIAALAARLIAWSVPARAARPLAWAMVLLVAGLLVWGAWSLWLGRHDKAVVEADRSAGTAQVLANVVAADRGAGATKDARDSAFAAEQSNLQEKADAAADNRSSPLDALFNELR